jgi:hypothetical protein
MYCVEDLMEKLLEFTGKGYQDTAKMYRFQCRCLHAADAMDIDVEEDQNDSKYIILRLDFIGVGFIDRIKYAWQILRGRWTWREFIIRKEDHQVLSEIFDPSKKYSDLW